MSGTYTSPRASALGGIGQAHSSVLAGSNPAVHTIFNSAHTHIMKILITVLALFALNVQAQERFYTSENPHEEFSVRKVNANDIQLTFISADNVQSVCDRESRKRGFGGFNTPVEACSFFDTKSYNNKCTIVVGKSTNYHTIGHEMRHCLQGNYHK